MLYFCKHAPPALKKPIRIISPKAHLRGRVYTKCATMGLWQIQEFAAPESLPLMF